MNVATLERVVSRAPTRKAEFPYLTAAEIDTNRSRLSSGFYYIEPTVAKQLLTHRNPVNRTLAPMKLRQLRHDMETGKFIPNGESIIFSSEGHLLDGQHRLLIASETETTILCNVAFGVAPEAQDTMDQGKVRGAGNQLALKGFANSNNIAAVARMAIAYEAGNGIGLVGFAEITHGEVIDRVVYDQDIAAVTEWALSLRKTLAGVVSTTYLAAARYVGTKAFGGKAEEFLHAVATGEGYMASGSPALATRNRLIAERTKKGALVLEILLRGMLAYAEGRSLTRIQTDGKLPKLPRSREGMGG